MGIPHLVIALPVAERHAVILLTGMGILIDILKHRRGACLAALLEQVALPLRVVLARQHDIVHCEFFPGAPCRPRHVAEVLPWHMNCALQECLINLHDYLSFSSPVESQ